MYGNSSSSSGSAGGADGSRCVILARGVGSTVCDNAQAASNADLKMKRASEQMMNDVRREIARAKSAADIGYATTIDADSMTASNLSWAAGASGGDVSSAASIVSKLNELEAASARQQEVLLPKMMR